VADLMVRTGIDARGFKRGLFAMEKDLGDASSRMASRFGGDRGFDPLRLDKGLGKAGAMAIGFNPRTGLIGGLVLGLKDAYGALERYEQKLPEVYRKTGDISKETGKMADSWARATSELLPALDTIGTYYDRITGRLGALIGIMMGGTSGPGQIDDFLKDVEAKRMREGSRDERDAYLMRRAADAKRLQGDALGADLLGIDADKKDALARLPADAQRLRLNASETEEARLSIIQNAELARARKIAEYQSAASKERDEEAKAAAKAREDESERERKATEEARKAEEEIIHKREDAQVDIYESQARFRNAKATTDEEKKSAEEARAYARYKREELDIKRRGLDVDQQNTLELFNQAEYEATIEAIRSRQDEKPAPRLQAPDGLDLSSAGAFASQGQAMAFQIPGKIDRTNALLQQANQTLRDIKQGQDGTARFSP
jgi:hypothetical protein